jgi:hypothetical protein
MGWLGDYPMPNCHRQSDGTLDCPYDAAGNTYRVGGTDQCPLLSNGNCGTPDNQYDCGSYRECAPVSGRSAYELAVGPGGTIDVPNANLWSIRGDGSMVWLGANGTPDTPPAWAIATKPSIDSSGNIQVANPAAYGHNVGPLMPLQPATPAPPAPVYTPPVVSAPAPVAAVPVAVKPTTSGSASSQNNISPSTSSTLIPGVPDIAVYAGVGLLAFILLRR